MLARDADTYDASLGTTNGLSLYLCRAHAARRHAERRSRSTRLEQKLGIHGSPTAAIAFEHARRRGGSARRATASGRCSSLMNNARLGVAAQGDRDRARPRSDAAVRYARERKQFGDADRRRSR